MGYYYFAKPEINESLNDILKPKSKKEIIETADDDIIIKTFKASKKSDWSSLHGYVETSYKQLVKLFGEPNGFEDGDKVSIEWIVEDEYGNIARLYDYKSYYQKSKIKKLNSFNWHIGVGNGGSKLAKELQLFIHIN